MKVVNQRVIYTFQERIYIMIKNAQWNDPLFEKMLRMNKLSEDKAWQMYLDEYELRKGPLPNETKPC